MTPLWREDYRLRVGLADNPNQGADSSVLKPDYLLDPLEETGPFREALLVWFREEGQDHPWRRTSDPWQILISEVMLQQTTVGAVKSGRRFELFVEEFPHLKAIDKASEEQLLKAWEGLGYYNRVRNLQKTARAVLHDWAGQFPRSAEDLEELPGVGPYTAGAIASFAFNEPAAIVDGNVARVLARLFDDATEIDSTVGKKQLWDWARTLLDHGQPRLYNSALMEVGQVFCKPKKPLCLQCPLAQFCRTADPESLPRKKKKAKTVEVIEHAILAREPGQVLLAKEEGTRRKGFYRLPLRNKEEVADLRLLQTSKYAITKHRVTLHLYEVTAAVPGGLRKGETWVPLAELEQLPIQSPVRKALQKAL
jgi:A/G-specific adenine glycosylase